MDPLDDIPLARFQVVLHTANPMWGFQVLDTETGERYGFGLTVLDAGRVAMDHEREAKRAARGGQRWS